MQPLLRVEDVVVDVATPCQPDAAVEHRQRAGPRAGLKHGPSADCLGWRRHGLKLQDQPQLEPRRWLFLNFSHRQIQAALAGQGVALARLALIGESLAQGGRVEPFGSAGRIDSPFGDWLVRWPARRDLPELCAFEDWVLVRAAWTRPGLDEAPDAPHVQGESAKMPRARTATV